MDQTAQHTTTVQSPANFIEESGFSAKAQRPHQALRKPDAASGATFSEDKVNQRARVATATFGEIVALLSFSPVFKHVSLGDLEWLVIPALATNQVTVVRGKLKDPNNLLVPLGVALWAHVSEEVEQKLEAQQQAQMPFRLAPHEWKSGEIPWLLAVFAPKEVAQELINKLEETVFKGKTFKRFAIGSVAASSQNSTNLCVGESKSVTAPEA